MSVCTVGCVSSRFGSAVSGLQNFWETGKNGSEKNANSFMHAKFWSLNLKRRDCLGELGINGKIILK
jgi:hypothetical protein